MKKTLYPAKICRPELSEVLFRYRLFVKLEALRTRQIVWVAAPGGSGKTTLASTYIESKKVPCLWYQVDGNDNDPGTFFHYLGLAGKKAAPRRRKKLPHFTQEYQLAPEEFSRYFFTELFDLLPTKSVLVFDNCQKVSEESGIYAILLAALTRVPQGTNLLCLSRNPPPPAFSRLKANRELSSLGWDDVRLTLDEFSAILNSQNISVSTEQVEQLFSMTDGWAAGLSLVTQIEELTDTVHPSLDKLNEQSKENIFEYFTKEVFEQLDKKSQYLLLNTSFLPFVDVQLAEKMTGDSTASSTLRRLFRNNRFINRRNRPGKIYQYHQLFHEFLVNRCITTFSSDQLRDLRIRTALNLIETSQIEEAGELLIAAQAWNELSGLITSHASRLFHQGRFQMIGRWLLSIPEQIHLGNPWLLYWSGMCHTLRNPEEGMFSFDKALRNFESSGDVVGIFLAISGMGDAIGYQFDSFKPYDQWIEKLEILCVQYPTFPSIDIEARVIVSMLNALSLRQPAHPKFGKWKNRAVTLLELTETISHELKFQLLVPLILNNLSSGALNDAERFIAIYRNIAHHRETPDLALLTLMTFEASLAWRAGTPDICLAKANEARAYAHETGIYVMSFLILINGASGALSCGDIDLADEMLAQIEEYREHRGAYVAQIFHFVKLWRNLLANNTVKARHHGELTVNLALTTACPEVEAASYLGYALALYECREAEEAKIQLGKALAICNKIQTKQVEFGCRLAKAEFAFADRDHHEGIESLAAALIIGREQNYFNFPGWRPQAIAKLCCRALKAGIEKEYVKSIIKKRKLPPTNDAVKLAEWPWPVRIYCLGRFELVCGSSPLRFTGKSQQKPLALLKALIARGGRKVLGTKLADDLWPDADGDMQHQLLNTNLYRLRKLLTNNRAIILESGELTISNNLCWIDAWAFERYVGEIEQLSFPMENSRLDLEKALKVIHLYKGVFLGSESDSWVIGPRDRLHNKFVRIIKIAGQYYISTSDVQKAIGVFQKGLEHAPLEEDLYIELMQCYLAERRYTDIIQLYEVCHKRFEKSLGLQPGPEMQRLYRKAIGEREVKI